MAQPEHPAHEGLITGMEHGQRRDGRYFGVYGHYEGTLAERQAAMGIDWPLSRREIVQAIRSQLDTPMMTGSGVLSGPQLAYRRRSCCLFYRLPGGSLCGDCGLHRTRR